MYITWETIITGGAVCGSVAGVLVWLVKVVRWVDRQKGQDRELAAIKHEQSILTYGVLACLKGLQEQGCNGPVTEAIERIETYLNERAHDKGGL